PRNNGWSSATTNVKPGGKLSSPNRRPECNPRVPTPRLRLCAPSRAMQARATPAASDPYRNNYFSRRSFSWKCDLSPPADRAHTRLWSKVETGHGNDPSDRIRVRGTCGRLRHAGHRLHHAVIRVQPA